MSSLFVIIITRSTNFSEHLNNVLTLEWQILERSTAETSYYRRISSNFSRAPLIKDMQLMLVLYKNIKYSWNLSAAVSASPASSLKMSDKFTCPEIYGELLVVRDVVVAWALVGVYTRVHLELLEGVSFVWERRIRGYLELWETSRVFKREP